MFSCIIGSSLKFRFLVLAVPWLKRVYGTILSRVVRDPRTTFAASLVIVVAGLAAWPLLGQSLLPAFKERDFLMHWVPPEGTSHPETFRITQLASRELRSIPGVRNFGTQTRRIDVHANVKGRDVGSVAEEINARLEKINFPIGYYPRLLGEYKERQAAQVRGQQSEVRPWA